MNAYMSRKPTPWLSFLAAFAAIQLLSGVSALHATTYYWETSGSYPLTDGAGNWNGIGGTNWLNYTNGTFGASGNNTGDTDVFGALNGAAGTITVGAVSAGTIIFNPAGSGNYTLSSGTITLGASGVITVNSNATIGSTLAGAGTNLTVNGGSTLTLTGSNSYTGTTIVSFSKLTLNTATGSLKSTTPLTLNGGTFNLDNTGAGAAYSGTLGALTFNSGDGTVSITETVPGDAQALKFSSLGARAAGATGNFVNGNDIAGGGVGNSGTSGFVLSGVTANSFINYGDFYEGANYAWNDGAGFVRAINYTSDAGAATNTGGSSGLSGSTYQQITGSVSGQNSATFTTIKLTGSSNFTLNSGQTVTVNGLLASGTTASTISGGTGIQAGSGLEMVIRTDSASDALTINTPILANGVNALTKSGAGTLTLGAANTYSGVTYLDGGTLNVSNTNAIGGGGNITFQGGTLQYSSGNQTDYSGKIVNSTGAISVDTNGQSVTWATALPASNTGNLVKLGAGTLTLNAAESYGGSTIVSSGTLLMGANGSLPGGYDNGQPIQVNAGATLNYNNGGVGWVGALSGNGTILNGENGNGMLISGNGWSSTFGGTIINSRIWFWGQGITLNMSGSSQLTANTGFGNNNPYWDPSTINLSGTITMGTNTNIGGGGAFNFNVNGGLFQNTAAGGIVAVSSQGNNGVNYPNNGTLTINSGTFSAPVVEAVVSAGNTIGGATPYIGGTSNIIVNGGVLSVGKIYNISNIAAVPMTLTVNGGTVQVNSLSGSGILFADGGYNNELNVQIGANGATINTNSYAVESQRPLNNIGSASSAGNLTVNGGGSLNLSGSGSFTGRTIVTGGATVRVSNDYDLVQRNA
jgi:autotransporter-associated beta strand protein